MALSKVLSKDEFREFQELTVMLKLRNGLDISKITAPKMHRFFKYLEKHTDLVSVSNLGEYHTKEKYLFKDRGVEYKFDSSVVFIPSKRKGKALDFRTIEHPFDLYSRLIREERDSAIIAEIMKFFKGKGNKYE